VIANFSVSGLVPISAAMAGREVAMTVESMFSMNKAAATISGIRRSLVIMRRSIPIRRGANSSRFFRKVLRRFTIMSRGGPSLAKARLMTVL